jgi:hypothetical protein
MAGSLEPLEVPQDYPTLAGREKYKHLFSKGRRVKLTARRLHKPRLHNRTLDSRPAPRSRASHAKTSFYPSL